MRRIVLLSALIFGIGLTGYGFAQQGGKNLKILPKTLTKPEIKKAVETLFGVKVRQVRVLNVHGKVKRQGRYAGKRPDWKKAYVVLKEGEKMLEFLGQA